jgi:hypothetical protein
VVTDAVSLALAALLGFAALRKLSHRPQVVASYARVGVPEGRLDVLAAILLAGTAGLVLGLAWEPIGIAATIGVIAYFALAIAAHIRHQDTSNLPAPAAIEALAVATLVLRLAT